ncbi:MAG: PaaI family thioesterase [Pedosphaera sp.]|nr:PaaI family thioesterase [Pedosphaera sp.]
MNDISPITPKTASPLQSLPHTRSCFVCGESNPVGLKLDLQSNGTKVETTVCFRPEHSGFSGVVHGGLITTVLDEAMAWTIGVRTRSFAFAAELNIRFLRPVAPGQHLTLRAKLVENRRGRLFLTHAILSTADGTIAAEGTGKFLPIPAARYPSLLADFISDPSPWIGPLTSEGSNPS